MRKHQSLYKQKIIRLIALVSFLIPLFHVAGYSNYVIFLAIPVFSMLILEISKAEPLLNSTKIKSLCTFLGRNSFGIYVWQVPMNSIIQSESIEEILNITRPGLLSFAVVVLIKILAIIIVSECTTRLFEKPMQKILLKRLVKKE